MNIKNINKSSQLKATALVLYLAVMSSEAGNLYEMKKYAIAGGGGQASSSTNMLRGTVGQNVTTPSTSASYQLNPGFIQENRDLVFFNKFENNN